MVNSVCEGNPCPEGTECIGDPKEGKYTCVCPDGKAGQCPGKKITLKNLCMKPHYSKYKFDSSPVLTHFMLFCIPQHQLALL